MMDNMGAAFKLMGLWNRFKANHPKFPMFMNAVMQNGIEEGAVFEINVTTAGGKTISSNIKLSADDMQIIEELKSSITRTKE